jgi:CYTH domain-containing protein
MAIEIERKFLVAGSQWRQADGVPISQGYLNLDKQRTVRVRLAGAQAFLAIKGITKGAARIEFEYPIPAVDARQLLKLCDGHVIEKIRHGIDYKGFTWEVDEFLGENAGLIVAEIELDAETRVFERPAWVAQEVTDDPRFFNSNLVMNPYCAWPHQPAG